MKLMPARLFVISISILALASGCKNVGKSESTAAQNPASVNRAPASPDDEEGRRTSFESLLGDANSSLHGNYLSRLMNIYYRIEGNLEKYERYLDQVIAKQKLNASYTENILNHEAYRKNLVNWALKDRLSDDVEDIYRRLLETQRDVNTTEERRTAATKILNQTYSWMESLDEEDRALMSEVFERMDNVKKSLDTAMNAAAGGRQVASVGKDFNFDKYAFHDQTNLSPIFKKHKASMHKKIARAYAWKDAEADAAPPTLDFSGDRAPSSPEPVKPGVGPYGNVTGLSFPTNTLVFTFDDGPHLVNDTKLFSFVTSYKDAVNPSGIPLTLFWQVKNVVGNEGSIEKAKALKFPMNNHSWNHPDTYINLGQAGWDKQINQANVYLTKAFGVQPSLGSDKFHFYRCPYGSCVPSKADMLKHPNLATNVPIVRKMIADLNLIHVFWAIDSNDWANTKNPERTFAITTKSILALKRGVILMHDIHASTIEAFMQVAAWVKDQNEHHGAKYKFVGLQQAVDNYNKQFAAGSK